MRKLLGSYHQIGAVFRRTTSSGSYIPEIDGLRFLSLSAIFIYHLRGFLELKSDTVWAVPIAQDWAMLLTEHWYYAVHFFFAISGFVLGLPFALHYLKGQPAVSLRGYYVRRLTRLEPPYLVSLVVLFILEILVLHQSFPGLVPHLLASMFYLHGIVFGQPSLINGVAWTLEIEVQFYLLAPLLARLFAVKSKILRRTLVGALAYSAIILQWNWEHATVLNASALDLSGLNLTILNFLQFFLVGFLLADLYALDWNQSPTSSGTWDVVAVFALGALGLVWEFPDVSYFIFPALLFCFYAAVFRSRYVRRFFRNSLLTVIGGMCYTIYLFHFQATWVVIQVTGHLVVTNFFGINLILQTMLVGAVVLASCSVYFLLIEKPCMDKHWHSRLLNRFCAMQQRITSDTKVIQSSVGDRGVASVPPANRHSEIN